MHHKEVNCHPERVSKIKPYINNISWENIIFLPQKQDYETVEMNNKSIALNVLQVNEEQKISHLYKSKFNKTRENKVIVLMISDNEKQYYLAVKNLNV